MGCSEALRRKCGGSGVDGVDLSCVKCFGEEEDRVDLGRHRSFGVFGEGIYDRHVL